MESKVITSSKAVADAIADGTLHDKVVQFPGKQKPSPEEEARALDAILDALVGRKEDDPAAAVVNSNTAPAPNAFGAAVTSQSTWPAEIPLLQCELRGGTYQPEDALGLLNSRFFLAKVRGAYPIAEIDGNSIKYISGQDFRT